MWFQLQYHYVKMSGSLKLLGLTAEEYAQEQTRPSDCEWQFCSLSSLCGVGVWC